MAKFVIAGGRGFLGQALTGSLVADGHEVVVLSRRGGPAEGRVRTVAWDGRTVGPWAAELDGAWALVNLTGRSIVCLYTPDNRREIMDSRVDSVRVLEAALAGCRQPPEVWLQASAIGIYGDAGDRVCDEAAPEGTGFTADVCRAWEGAFFAAPTGSGPRRVALRIGVVLGRDGGALPLLAGLTRGFLGGATGSGRQYISWVSLADLCALFRWAIDTPSAHGRYNATAPDPVTNAAFMRTLRQVLHRPWCPPAPAWAVRVAARFLLRVEPEFALAGRRCVPARLLEAGFRFRDTDLAATLRGLLAQKKV
jgi:uncharacterized protein (TIGR01777 family)